MVKKERKAYKMSSFIKKLRIFKIVKILLLYIYISLTKWVGQA